MSKVKEELLRSLKFCYQEGLIWGQSGSISVRTRNSQLMITPRGATYSEVQENQLGTYDWAQKRWRGRGIAPIDVKVHSEVYRNRAGIKAAILSQPPYTTLIACSDISVETAVLPLGVMQIDKVVDVPYFHPGSDDLVAAINEKSTNSDVILLRNFGVLVGGATLKEVIDKVVAFEYLSKLTISAYSSNMKIRALSKETVASLQEYVKIHKINFCF
ncbi:MAG: class II aldolase/adducin family protein [Vulcanimicrobiota bacterium]